MAEHPKGDRSTASPTTLNDLPGDLLVHILSFLPLLSAIQTTILSRRWRNLWHSLPSLLFNAVEFPSNLEFTDPEYHQRFAEFITEALLNRSRTIPFHKFHLKLYYSYNHRHRSYVSTWLRYALDCSVDDVELNFYLDVDSDDEEDGMTVSGSKSLYDFHFSDLKNSSVRRLSLWLCEIVMPSSDLIRFESLRDLEFTDVKIDDELLSDLISRCGNLEKLDLCNCHGLRKFRISSESLKILLLGCDDHGEDELDWASSSEIRTPNLSVIEIRDFYVANYSGELSSAVKAKLLFLYLEPSDYAEKCWCSAIKLLSGVEDLLIQNWFLQYSKIHSGERLELKKLKHLELKTQYTADDMLGLCYLLKGSPALETLVLDYNYGQTDDDACFLDNFAIQPFDFHIPSLRELKMKYFRNTTAEYAILRLFSLCKVVLKKVVLVPNFLGEASSHSVVLDLTTSDDLLQFLGRHH